MTYHDALRSHVERSLRHDLGIGRIEPDEDGDWPVCDGSVVCWVHLCGDDPALARVWSIAVTDVKRSAALLTELNDVNADTRLVRCFWADGSVVVAGELVAESLEPGELGALVRSVAGIAAHVGQLVAAVYGGQVPVVSRADSELTGP